MLKMLLFPQTTRYVKRKPFTQRFLSDCGMWLYPKFLRDRELWFNPGVWRSETQSLNPMMVKGRGPGPVT